MLLEDQNGVGETVYLGEANREVESVRACGLNTSATIDGTLWYFRNGEIEQRRAIWPVYDVARFEPPVALTTTGRASGRRRGAHKGPSRDPPVAAR
jgi:small conductance mechanosensitive channel